MQKVMDEYAALVHLLRCLPVDLAGIGAGQPIVRDRHMDPVCRQATRGRAIDRPSASGPGCARRNPRARRAHRHARRRCRRREARPAFDRARSMAPVSMRRPESDLEEAGAAADDLGLPSASRRPRSPVARAGTVRPRARSAGDSARSMTLSPWKTRSPTSPTCAGRPSTRTSKAPLQAARPEQCGWVNTSAPGGDRHPGTRLGLPIHDAQFPAVAATLFGECPRAIRERRRPGPTWRTWTGPPGSARSRRSGRRNAARWTRT